MDRDVAAPLTGGGQAYQRAAVDEFLAAADREQRRLRELIDDAHARRAAAQQVARRSSAMTEQARSALQDLQRELSEQRREVEAEAARIVREGQDAAASRLRRARDDARALLFAHDVVLDAPDEVDIDLIALQRAEHGTEPMPAYASAPPLKMMSFEEAILLSSEDDDSGNGFSGNGFSGNGFSGNGSNGNGASGSGSSAHTSGNGVSGNGSSRSSGLAGILRRTRGRTPVEQTDEGPDEFLEFLRGALLDDAPLGPIDDEPETLR